MGVAQHQIQNWFIRTITALTLALIGSQAGKQFTKLYKYFKQLLKKVSFHNIHLHTGQLYFQFELLLEKAKNMYTYFMSWESWNWVKSWKCQQVFTFSLVHHVSFSLKSFTVTTYRFDDRTRQAWFKMSSSQRKVTNYLT